MPKSVAMIWFALLLLVVNSSLASEATRDSTTSPNEMAELISAGTLLDSIDIFRQQFELSPAYIFEYEMVVENVLAKTSFQTTYRRTLVSQHYILLNELEDSFTTVRIDLTNGKEDLVAFKAQVTNPGGDIQVYDENDLLWSGADASSGKLAFRNIKEGAIVHVVYETKEQNPSGFISELIPLQYHVPVRDLNVSIYLPNDLFVRFKEIREGYTPEFVKSDAGFLDLVLFQFDRHNVAPITDEPYSPPRLKMIEYAAYNVVGFEGRDNEVVDLFTSDVATLLKGISLREGNRHGARFIRRFTQQLIDESNAETTDEKIDVIVDYVRNNTIENSSIEYPTYVELIEDGQGDRWTITDLLRAMLDHIRVPSHYVVIHDKRFGYFDSLFLDNSMQTPALQFEYGGKDILCFPYLPNVEVGVIPPYLQNEVAYTVRGYSDIGMYDTIVIQQTVDNAVREQFNVHMDNDGVVTVEEITRYSGAYAYNIQMAYSNAEKEDKLEEFFDVFVTYDEGVIETTEREFISAKRGNETVEVRVRYSLDNLVTVLPEEVIFQTGGLLTSNVPARELDSAHLRINPIENSADEIVEQSIHISFPSTWRAVTDISTQSVSNDIGSTSISSSSSAGSMRIERKRFLNEGAWGKERAEDLYNLLNVGLSSSIPTIVFEK